MIKYEYDKYTAHFISSDSFDYLEPETIGGIDLYAYCGNNPVMNVDPTGCDWETFRDWFSTITGLLNPISKVTALGAIIVAMCAGRWDDLKSDWENGCFNPFNQEESVALESKVFSFYKGESVIRHSFNNSSCQIFGNIFLSYSNLNNSYGIIALNHEFGHGIQERLYPNYLLRIAIPSAITYFVGVRGSNYYSMPWERTADYYGGVDSGYYKADSLTWAFIENAVGGIVIPFYFIIGY